MSDIKYKITYIPTEITAGITSEIKRNTHGASIQWIRLTSEDKDRFNLIGAKNNREYGAQIKIQSIESGINWLLDNIELENVKDWWETLFLTNNRTRMTAAGSAGLKKFEAICDIESLIFDATLEKARGRKAKYVSTEAFKILGPIFSLAVKKLCENKGMDNPSRVVNTYMPILKSSVVQFAILTDLDRSDRLSKLLEATLCYVVEHKPEHEGIVLQAIETLAANRAEAEELIKNDELIF